MNTKNLKSNRSGSFIIGIIVALLIGAVLADFHRRLGLSDRTAFGILTVIGLIFCSTGMKIDIYGWKNPFNLVGAFLGVIILLLVAAVFTGIPFPGVASDHEAFIALIVLISLKVVIDLLRALAGKLTVSAQHTTSHS
jgi:CDP-diglyceride synthetase